MVQGVIKKTLSPTPLQLVAMISRITGPRSERENWPFLKVAISPIQ